MRPIQATISTSALAHNLNIVKQHAPNSKVMAVVKANAYGHGLLNAAQGLAAADGFAVLNLSEAIDLREAGFAQKILLLEGVFSPQELQIAASFDLDIVVHAAHQLEMLTAAPLKRKLNIHLKMNTGMNRLGFTPAAYRAAYARAQASGNVGEITLMTHFATADEATGIDSALQSFTQAASGLVGEISLANSATILRHPQAHANWVRPGIMLYGASPVSGTPAAQFGLKPAMQLTSQIIAVQEIKAGESLGYGKRFTANKAMRIGIVACGYADGYPRHAGQFAAADTLSGAPIAVAGKLTRTLGRVSMDMLFCDITNIPQANIGAPVELWGAQVPVDSVAEACGTVGYELLCAVSPRVAMKVVE